MADNVIFRDLYDAMRNTENAFTRVGVDIDAAKCGMPKCILTNAQDKLLENYMELANIDLDFCDLDFLSIIKRITECFDCVTDEFKDMIPPPLPEPEDVLDNCGTKAETITLNEIKRFRIYERTYTDVSIPSPVQVYTVPVENLPYSFKPSVPETYSSHELYTLSWNPARNSLVVKVDHDQFPESMGAPTGSFNICMIVAELRDTVYLQYNTSEVKACTALLMTPGVEWYPNMGLDKSVDGLPTTYSSYSNSPPEVKVEYQFKWTSV